MPTDHVCRVIDSSVEGSAMLGFERAEAAETGRPDYGPRDLLKLYLYGYVNQIRSSRRWECLDSTLTFFLRGFACSRNTRVNIGCRGWLNSALTFYLWGCSRCGVVRRGRFHRCLAPFAWVASHPRQCLRMAHPALGRALGETWLSRVGAGLPGLPDAPGDAGQMKHP